MISDRFPGFEQDTTPSQRLGQVADLIIGENPTIIRVIVPKLNAEG